MGFFSSIIKGGLKLLGGSKRRKQERSKRASEERLVKLDNEKLAMQMQSEDRRRSHELEMNKNNKKSFIPWVIGGISSLVLLIGMIFMKPKNRRR